MTVTAGDGMTKDYTVTVTRAAGGVGSSDADLTDLTLSEGTLNPAFDAATTEYTARVGNTVEEVTVTATKSDADAKVAQSPTNPVDLDVGDTEITVTVTAEDGTTKAYTVEVTRAAARATPGVRVSIEEVTVTEGTERDYTVRLNTRPSGDVTVEIAVEEHDDNPEDGTVADHVTITRTALTFNETNWNRARTVTIGVTEDDDEITEIANLIHTAVGYTADTAFVKVTATDNDIVAGAAIRVDRTSVRLTEGDEDDSTAEVMVRLAVVPTGPVTVTVATPEDGAATVAPTSLTFTAANWDDEQTVTVTAADDPDPADGKATVTLSAADGGYGSAEDVKVEITVADDEEATISVSNDFKNAEVVEGGNITYNIILSANPPEGKTVRVNLQVLGLATVIPGQAVFTSETAEVGIPVTVTTLQDSDDDDARFSIRHSVDADKDSGYKGAAAPSNINVTVKDNEAAGVVVSRTSLSVEEGGMVTYTVSLTKAPTDTEETVTVHLAGAGVNVDPVSLVFENGEIAAQTVTVTGHTDSNSVDDDGTVVHTVVTTGGDGDKDYEGVTASTVRITVTEPEASSS